MYQSIPAESGIYKITCKPNGKIYIGSSINLRRRWSTHKYSLRKGTHCNAHLQRAWNKYGEHGFVFEVVEIVEVSNLEQCEQYYLDALRAYDDKIGFNISKDARSPWRGHKLSPEHCLKIGLASKGRAVSPQQRKKLSDAAKKQMAIPGARDRITEKLGLRYLVVSPEGLEYQVKGLASFCREHGLHTSNMCAVSKGKLKHCKGWRCYKA